MAVFFISLDKHGSKRHWFIILNEGLEGTWQNNSNEVINVARNLRIKCAHVISGAGDISAVGAYCNNEELAKMLTLLELKRGDIRKANVGEAKLFAQQDCRLLAS